jgi:hypothetical protein
MAKNRHAMNNTLIPKPASVLGYPIPIRIKNRLMAATRRRKMLTGSSISFVLLMAPPLRPGLKGLTVKCKSARKTKQPMFGSTVGGD